MQPPSAAVAASMPDGLEWNTRSHASAACSALGLCRVPELLVDADAVFENSSTARAMGTPMAADAPRPHPAGRSRVTSTAVTAALCERMLDKRDQTRPMFMFVNLIGPHSPYNSAGKFTYRFVSKPSIRLFHNMWREYYLGHKTFTPDELEWDDEVLLDADWAIGSPPDRALIRIADGFGILAGARSSEENRRPQHQVCSSGFHA